MSFVYSTIAKTLLPVFAPKLKDVKGFQYLPKRGGYIIASNHVDWLDGFYIAAAMSIHAKQKVHFLTKSNNYWWTTATVQIPPDRSHVVDDIASFLRQGNVICNFIEGQRNTSNILLPGKTGTARMAMLAKVPVLPLGISCAPGRTMAESIKQLLSKQHAVRIRVGSPIHLSSGTRSDLSREDVREATQRIMNAIAPLAGKRN